MADLLGVGCWVLVAGCWLLGVGCWVLVAGCWLLGVGCWVLVAGCWLHIRANWHNTSTHATSMIVPVVEVA